ncbi:MAG TPA: flagellar basal body-associated FliL family protein [Clostridia bacterium]|nr:flagellar basal body-associated FliL family protein [Clostridia bacterium]
MKKTLTIILITFVVTVSLGTLFLWLYPCGGKADKPKKTYTYDTGDAFVCNLQDSDRFLILSVIIELDSKDKVSKLSEKSYKVRDTIMDVLVNYSEETVTSPGANEVIKEDIREVLLEEFSLGSIEDVYLEEFVVQ